MNHENWKVLTLYKKWSFRLRISSVNVTKSAVFCLFNFFLFKVIVNPKDVVFWSSILRSWWNIVWEICLKKYIVVYFRPIIVNFSFIVISCTRSSMQHAVIIWLFGKIFENFVFSSLPFFMCFYMSFVHTLIDFEMI